MEAIRCKSSSQVGSQVMISLGLLLIFLVVEASGTKTYTEKYRSQYAKAFNEYEFCVKLIVACEKLQDKVEDFESESDELFVGQDKIDAAMDKYKRFGCIPSGLSLSGLRSYWNLVSKWEREVHELFLLQNFISVIQEKNGHIKVKFGKAHYWCPRADDLLDITFTSAGEAPKQTSTLKPELISTTKKNNESVSVGNITDSCQASSDVDRWVHNEINGLLNMSSFTDRFSNFETLLRKYRNQSCCSYKSIRDRVEFINDGIDILEELQDLKPSEKKDYTDIESDYRNLNSRLAHLKTDKGHYSSEKCCPGFSDQIKSFQNNFQSNFNKFNPPKSNITLKDLLKNLTYLEDTCFQQENQLTKSLEDLNNKNNKIDNNCCGEVTNKINLMDNSLRDIEAVKSQPDLSENINSVRENLEKANKNLLDTENMLSLEAKEIEKLKNECEKVNRMQASKTLINGLSSNVSKLVDKLDDMAIIRTVNLSKLNSPFDSLQNLDTTFDGINSSTRPKNTENQKQDIASLKNTFRNVNMKYSNLEVRHELYQEAARKDFQKYQKDHDDLKESMKAIEGSPEDSRSKDGKTLKSDINQLEMELVNLKDNTLPKLALEIKDRRKEITSEVGEKIAGKMEKKIASAVEESDQKAITWFNEAIKRKKKQILDRLDKLNQNKMDSEKVRQLEAHILQLSERHNSLAKKIADRHEVLKQNVQEINLRIAEASSNALSCQIECSLENFPTMDSLAKRVKVLDQQLNKYLKKKEKN
ncbi:hypothetical protein KR032_005114 [Drosophila birchii]|nr:hypothetical protein KR032_005114 [Drosophila birchii]